MPTQQWLLAAAVLLAGCDATRLTAFIEIAQRPAQAGADVGSSGSGSVAGSGGSAGSEPEARCNPCDDFPEAPIVDDSGAVPVPDDVGDLFGQPDAAGVGPCLIAPELGSLFPSNWLRPRFRWIAAVGQSLFELRLHAAVERHDLVVYTSSTEWTLPEGLWRALTQNVVDQPITVSLRGLDPSATPALPSLALTGSISIAPVAATGSVRYFTSTGAPTLKRFAVGEESVHEDLTPAATTGKCVACHSTTPDDAFVAASISSDTANGNPAHIELHGIGGGDPPSYLTESSRALLLREEQHFPSFSSAHYATGDRVMVHVLNGQLAWTDLEAGSQTEGGGWGIFQRSGDPAASITHPTLSHSGTRIAYTSIGQPLTIAIADHTDVYVVPYAERQGGEATALLGASSPDYNEYYPAFSADDALIAFNRSFSPPPAVPTDPLTSGTSTYANPQSELYVVPAAGGVAHRLLANDPPACLGKTSPGVSNSWASWSREVVSAAGKTYYFLAFSSTRLDAMRGQLYATAVVIDSSGQITTYPALHFWNQPELESNHEPIWLTPGAFESP